MTTTAIRVCEIKHGLFGSRCGGEPAGVCQYCGRLFCAGHGVVLADGQEICSRRFCVAKREDLEVHLAYKAVVQRRNAEKHCGIEGCGQVMSGQCVRCKGVFCGLHVESREEQVQQNLAKVTRMATLCHHCWKRRAIWLRS